MMLLGDIIMSEFSSFIFKNNSARIYGGAIYFNNFPRR